MVYQRHFLNQSVKNWRQYSARGSSQGRSPYTIMNDWMFYACQNFEHNAERTFFFDNLFRFAQFTQDERIDAINVCRSQQFLSRLSPERRILIMEEIERYDNVNQLAFNHNFEAAQVAERFRQILDDEILQEEYRRLVQVLEDEIRQESEEEEDNFTSLTFSSRGRQAVPPPSQAVPVEEEDFGDDIPPDFLCPLSLSIMEEPVIASDGHTYEKYNIQTWMVQKKNSPITREKLLSHLFPNLLLKNQIDDWKKAYRKAKTDAEA
jgi:U-box domain